MQFRIIGPPARNWQPGDDETVAEIRAKARMYIRSANQALAQPQRCRCGQCGWCVHGNGLPPLHLRHHTGNEVLIRSGGVILSVR